MPAHGAVFATTGHASRPRMLTLLAGLADLTHACVHLGCAAYGL